MLLAAEWRAHATELVAGGLASVAFASGAAWTRARRLQLLRQVAILVSAGLALVLLAVVPWMAPRRACQRLESEIIGEATPDLYPERDLASVSARLLARLTAQRRTYAFLVQPKGDSLGLTFTGRWLGCGIRWQLLHPE